MMKSIKIIYTVFVLLIVFSGCRKDEKIDGPVINEPTGDPTIEVVSGVTGIVTNEQGDAISNATIYIYNRQTKSDENGIFFVNNVGLKKTNSPIRITKPGYFDGFKSFIPALGKKSYVAVQLVERGQPQKIQSSEGGLLSLNGGAELILPANGIVEKDGGASYTGEVNVYTHWYDPLDEDLGLTMPGNLLGIESDESEVQLLTYGMIAVELESSTGVSLQLSADSKAQLKFPAPSELDLLETIPLWYFDEIDGVWQKEGDAKLVDGSYQAEVSHFSFWNCDYPYPLIDLEGRVIHEGNPLSNFPVTIMLNGGGSAGFGYTDNQGVFRGKVPKDESLLLILRNCGTTIVNEEIGPFSNDVNIGDINVDLLNFETTIQGRMVDCFDQPLEDAYGLLKVGQNVVQVISPLSDGTFFTTVAGCSNNTYTVQFYDPVGLKSNAVMEISTEMGLNDLMDVRICDGLDEYVQYSVDGELAPLMTPATVFVSNNEKLIIRAGEDFAFESFDMDIFAASPGIYNPSTVAFRGYPGFENSELVLMCGDHATNYVTCEDFTVEILSYNTYVTGTFSGLLVTNQDTISSGIAAFDEYTVTGSFRVKIDDNITTGEISGQFWLDENNNNMREGEEDLTMITQTVSIQRLDGNNSDLFPSFLVAYGQSYKFTDLLPGTYRVTIFKTPGYMEVIKDVGSDDTDSDFDLVNNQLITDDIVITGSEVYNNVDCGFEVPSSVQCGNLYSYGCVPNIGVGVGINGGVPPYTVTLNGTQSIEIVNYAVFEVAQGGDYTIEVEDAVGNTCSSEGFVNDYNNFIQGYVWRDVDGGTPNVYDPTDFRLNNIGVELYNEAGDLIASTLSVNGVYTFQYASPGNHYIQIDVPSNLTILDQDTNTNNGNDINPSTEQSNIFNVDDCNDYIRIDAGLKFN